MELGLSSFTFGWAVAHGKMTHGRLVDVAREERVSRLQIGDNLPLDALDVVALDQLKRRAADAGVTLEVGARGMTRENAAHYLDITRRLGSPLLRFVIDQGDYEPEFPETAGILRELLPTLEDASITIGIENHDRWAAETYRRLMEAVAHPRVGICLDTANSLGAGEGVGEVLRVLAPYVVNLHVKDFVIRRRPNLMGFTVEGCPTGQGLLDVPSLLEKLAPFGRCQSAILEVWTEPACDVIGTIRNERRSAKESLKYLRSLFRSRT